MTRSTRHLGPRCVFFYFDPFSDSLNPVGPVLNLTHASPPSADPPPCVSSQHHPFPTYQHPYRTASTHNDPPALVWHTNSPFPPTRTHFRSPSPNHNLFLAHRHPFRPTKTRFRPTTTRFRLTGTYFDQPAPISTHQHPFRPTGTRFRHTRTLFDTPGPVSTHQDPFQLTRTPF